VHRHPSHVRYTVGMCSVTYREKCVCVENASCKIHSVYIRRILQAGACKSARTHKYLLQAPLQGRLLIQQPLIGRLRIRACVVHPRQRQRTVVSHVCSLLMYSRAPR
jgi:hypothetical protein